MSAARGRVMGPKTVSFKRTTVGKVANEWRLTWSKSCCVATRVSFASYQSVRPEAGAFAQHELVSVDLQPVRCAALPAAPSSDKTAPRPTRTHTHNTAAVHFVAPIQAVVAAPLPGVLDASQMHARVCVKSGTLSLGIQSNQSKQGAVFISPGNT